jgi:hypothetical protein
LAYVSSIGCRACRCSQKQKLKTIKCFIVFVQAEALALNAPVKLLDALAAVNAAALFIQVSTDQACKRA